MSDAFGEDWGHWGQDLTGDVRSSSSPTACLVNLFWTPHSHLSQDFSRLVEVQLWKLFQFFNVLQTGCRGTSRLRGAGCCVSPPSTGWQPGGDNRQVWAGEQRSGSETTREGQHFLLSVCIELQDKEREECFCFVSKIFYKIIAIQ